MTGKNSEAKRGRRKSAPITPQWPLGWQHDSLVRISVLGCQTFPDLWLTCDHFVGKLSAIGQPTTQTQPSVPPGSVNE